LRRGSHPRNRWLHMLLLMRTLGSTLIHYSTYHCCTHHSGWACPRLDIWRRGSDILLGLSWNLRFHIRRRNDLFFFLTNPIHFVRVEYFWSLLLVLVGKLLFHSRWQWPSVRSWIESLVHYLLLHLLLRGPGTLLLLMGLVLLNLGDRGFWPVLVGSSFVLLIIAKVSLHCWVKSHVRWWKIALCLGRVCWAALEI
jgi:hypothetical protein